MASETLAEYVASQDNLVQEAAEALPHQFSKCTYPLGHIRQAVYLCLTCPESRGICPACSIACHTDHEQIELFPKRHFRCDCPTEGISHPCSLHTISGPVNEQNQYGQNFQALFCRCKRPYDATTEKETMIQCLACEDWFHESCCNLRERPEPANDSPIADAASDASTDLPPPLIGSDDYDAFVCYECVSNIPILQKYAGTLGFLMVVRNEPVSPWKILPEDPDERTVDVTESSTSSSGSKRPLSPTADAFSAAAKKARLSPTRTTSSVRCLAPGPSPTAQKYLTSSPPLSLSTGDLFLSEGFRDRWCRCSECLLELEKYPYLLTEEDTYEPPEDPDSALSLEELGMRALARLPRERAIDGIHAFNALRDDLVKYLRPFAQEGKVVNEADVKSFFERMLEEKRASRKNQG